MLAHMTAVSTDSDENPTVENKEKFETINLQLPNQSGPGGL